MLFFNFFFPDIFSLCLWSGGFGHGAELKSTMSLSTIENIINNSIGSRNRKNNDCNSAYISRYVSQLNGSASSKRDDIFSEFHLNIQGLCSSFDELKRIISGGTPDVIGLHETFLDSKKDILLDIPGYWIERLNRKQMARGGLVLYIADRLAYNVRSDLSRNEEGIFESLFIDIKSM